MRVGVKFLGLEEDQRLTEDAKAKMLEEAVKTSYRKGGESTSISDTVSKQAVKNEIHNLEFKYEHKGLLVKKKVDYLYIDTDEEHILAV